MEVKAQWLAADGQNMAATFRNLRYDGSCAVCGCATPARSRAWWDAESKRIVCSPCWSGELPATPVHAAPGSSATNDGSVLSPWAPPTAIVPGTGGVSATKEYERRRAAQDRRIEAKWGTGRIGRIAKVLSDEPQSTPAWAKGADGERRLARRLTDEMSEIGVVLHDRKVPGTRGNIDHLVISPTGVWVIDAKNYTGKVEVRDVGGLFRTELRLFVGSRDHTKLVDGMGWQVDAVRGALAPIGFGELPVHPVLCFTSSEWPMFAKPQGIKGVRVMWPSKLIELAQTGGSLEADANQVVAHQLSDVLPAAG